MKNLITFFALGLGLVLLGCLLFINDYKPVGRPMLAAGLVVELLAIGGIIVRAVRSKPAA